MISKDRGPIFLGGIERSGKTYMRLMLASHPNIAMSRRTNLWPKFYQRYGDLSRTDNFQRCFHAMLQYKHIVSLKPDADRILAEFQQGEPTYARLFALFEQHYAERLDKPRWGDQTELIERYTDPIMEAYPSAKFIHMIRDPRDQYVAGISRRSGRKRKGSVGGAIGRWLYSARLAKLNQEKYPGRYLIVRYETMVTEPEATIHQVCDYISEEYDPAMLSIKSTDRFDSDDLDEQEGRISPLSTGFIGDYIKKLSKGEVAFIQATAAEEMKSFGYSLEPITLSFLEKLNFYALLWPLNMGRMVAWRSTKSVRFNQSRHGEIALVSR